MVTAAFLALGLLSLSSDGGEKWLSERVSGYVITTVFHGTGACACACACVCIRVCVGGMAEGVHRVSSQEEGESGAREERAVPPSHPTSGRARGSLLGKGKAGRGGNCGMSNVSTQS